MKVLHIITGDAWAGAEVQATTLIHALSADRAVRQEVLSFNNGTLVGRLRTEGVRVTVVEEASHKFLALLSACRHILATFLPDVVHTHGFKENFIGGLAARSGPGRVVRTHHGRGMIGASVRHDLIERINASFLTDALIAVSQDLENLLRRRGLSAKKLSVVLNGVVPIVPSAPAAVARMKTDLGLAAESTVIGTVGRLVPVKDHALFLNAARAIASARPDARFVIVGDGPLMAELVARTSALGLDGKVVFAGFRDDARRLGEVFDIFALTSQHEGIPMALLEAMSLGKPVVVTAVGGIPEIVRHLSNGLLVQPRDGLAFAKACLDVIEDRCLRDRIAVQAADDARTKYSADACANGTIAVYRRALAS